MKHFKSCEWVYEHLSTVKLLDAGIVKAGLSGPYVPPAVIQGAQRFDFGKTFADEQSLISNTMCSANQFEREAQKLGLSQQDTIIVYDVQGLYSAARAWWMFKAVGFNEVYVLDGGLTRWMTLGYPTASSYAKASEIGNFKASALTDFFVDKHRILEVMETSHSLILDARGQARFSGVEKEPRAGMRSGHIPSSQSLSYSLISNEDGTVKSTDALASLFRERQAQDKALYFSCGSGVTACVLAIAASECGYSDLHVYDGSWSEWGADDSLPIATGQE